MTHPFTDRWNHNTHHYPRLRALLPPDAVRVLDVGCGEGTLVRFLRAGGHHAVGLDPDVAVLPPGAVGGSGTALPFRDAAFDALTTVTVLHHVDPRVALAEMSRVLRPGGTLLALGLGRFGGRRDAIPEALDVLAQRFAARHTTAWEPPTVKTGPVLTWAETRSLMEECLPGCHWSRVRFWRYLVRWRKPS